ncbi:MAG: hypothetical protein KAT66_08455 [Candidatus Lokiarchaeota archaeon]|nr:hypothetical protein [Candidatus Lokiarchaeota archaeon]
MSIDKWFSDKDSKEEEIKREKLFKALPQEKVQELKKRKIRDLTEKEKLKADLNTKKEDFLSNILEFKDWLNQRNYLKGDLDKIETWVLNLYKTVEFEQESRLSLISDRKQLIDKYKKIPPKFLDEKTRVAINKKLYNSKKTSSDYYILRKLKEMVNNKLKEAEYYHILRRILEI